MADENAAEARANPLSETDLDDINRALGRLGEAEELIGKAQMAGIDVEPFRVEARKTADQLHKIKQAFFPGR